MHFRKHPLFSQGFYKPLNREKYEGNPCNIIYRSSWELKLFTWLDNNKNVISWNSEEIIVPYLSPKDGKIHRYFPDCKAKMKTNNGIKTYLIEVKPQSQLEPPKKRKKVTKGYMNEALTYAINMAKFEAAQEYCKKRGWLWTTLNEQELFGDVKK